MTGDKDGGTGAKRALGDDDVERVAEAIHEDYRRRAAAAGLVVEHPLPAWPRLSETLRRSNRDQALDIEPKLATIGYTLASGSADTGVTVLSEDEIEQLALLEHDRWVRQRLADGWVADPERDRNARRTPYLVPWSSLPEEVRDLDRDAVRCIPEVLAAAGFAIVACPRASDAGP